LLAKDLLLDKKVALSWVFPAPNIVSQMPGHKYAQSVYKMSADRQTDIVNVYLVYFRHTEVP